MNYAISVLQKRATEIKAEIDRLKSISDFEVVSDIMFVDNEIKNLNTLLEELNQTIMLLYNEQKKPKKK